MRRFAIVLALLLFGVCAVLSGSASADATQSAQIVFHLHDSRIDEASGIGVGIRSPGVDYVENDSGDTNRFFALNATTGKTAAVITVPGVSNVDWEDLQVAPDASGAPCVWLADIGDNDADRREIEIYRVPEPRIDPDGHDRSTTSARPAVWRLRYPSGPTDAESLAVTPMGDAYVVTKSPLGTSIVYRVPARPDRDRDQQLAEVGSVNFAAARGRSPVGSAGSLLATSAAVSQDGRLLAVRNYIYALVWRLHPSGSDDGIAAGLRTAPTRVTLPAEPQGEGIAFDGDRLLVDSEGTGTSVWSVPLPGTLTAARSSAAPSASPSPSGSSTPGPGQRSGGRFSGLSIIVLVLLVGGVVLLGRRARGFGEGRR